jgi:hypothetical protein
MVGGSLLITEVHHIVISAFNYLGRILVDIQKCYCFVPEVVIIVRHPDRIPYGR